MASSLQHHKGGFFWLKQIKTPEMEIAIKQAEKALMDYEANEFANLIKAAAL